MSDEIKSKEDKKNTAIGCVTVLIILIIIVAFAMKSCNSNSKPATSNISTVTDTAKACIQADETKFKNYNQQIAKYSKQKDKDNTTKMLTEAASWSNNESDVLLKLANSKGLDKEVKQACLDMKTGLYVAQSTCYAPMIEVMQGKTTSLPDYQTNLEKATTLIDGACNAIK